MVRRFYVTTPIYYVNDRPHIGHVFTTTLADVLARHRRLVGDEVFFLTGTDEHAAKVVEAAADAGLSTLAWADRNAETFRATFERLGLEPDDFIRTTQQRHRSRVEAYVRRLMDSGAVYAGQYEGWYDAGQEEYVPENRAREQDYKSAITGRPLVRKAERNYFFRLSAYRDALLARYEEGSFAVEPQARRNEVLARIREGLIDIPMSRSGATDWGIRVPGDGEQTIYVWIDALFNYLTCVDTDERRAFWPPDVQYVGKDILWFHAVIWPALLLALRDAGLDWVELPRRVYVHSFWTSEGQKMSKSLGNAIGLEQLDEIVSTFGLDALRWFLVTRGPVSTNDSDFARARFLEVYNSELANAIGNCASRVLNMTRRWFDGRCPASGPQVEGAAELRAALEEGRVGYARAVEALDLPEAALAGLRIVRAIDLFIDRSRPFELAKREDGLPAVGTILANCAEALRQASLLLWPTLPERMAELWRALGCERYATALAGRGRGRLAAWLDEPLAPGTELGVSTPSGATAPLFPRLRPEDALAPARAAAPRPGPPLPQPATPDSTGVQGAPIGIEQFQALDLRIARVLDAQVVPKADRLLRLELELEDGERRTVLSGIRESYAPEDVVGRAVLYLANLAPRTIRGVESRGMVLAGHDEQGRAVLLHPGRDVPPGSRVS